MLRYITLSIILGIVFTTSAYPDIPVHNQPSPKIQKEDMVGDLTGYYVCKGREANGKGYGGICVITKHNEVYVLSWTIGDGSSFVGIGIRQGDTLSVSWSIPGDKGIVRGVNVYGIEPGPRLDGRWAAIPGSGRIATEVLSFLRHLEEEE